MKRVMTRDYAIEMLKKCYDRINSQDFSGAITAARSLLEDVIARDIVVQITGKEIPTKGKLTNDYRSLQPLLNLSPNLQSDEYLKQLAESLVSAIESIANIRNKMGDSHSQESKPEKHHARFVVDAAITLVNFLYDTLDYSKNLKDRIFEEWNGLPYVRYGEGNSYYGKNYNLKTRNDLLSIAKFSNFYCKCDHFLKRFLVDKLISEFRINSFNDSDKFFISMVIFFDVLDQNDIAKIYQKERKNKQAAISYFLEDIAEVKSYLIPEDILKRISSPIS